MKKHSKKAGVIFIILSLGFIFHYKYINEFPSHIHAWAQSDRYALALGFLENGLNFFEPQSYILNHQFPHNWELPSEKGITAVDFPLHDYIPAVFMKIFGTTAPWIFRSYILLYSFLGLYFLFKLSHCLSKNYLKSIFVVIFAASSPVYVYYQGGFLPTIPCLSNSIIGIYFYYRYLSEDKIKNFRYSILFLSLAALSRTTFIIPLVAVYSIEFLRILRKETSLKPKLIPLMLSITALLTYFLYNDYLREHYGSIFLNYLMPPDDYEHLKEIVKSVYDLWIFQYFSKPQYFILTVVAFLAIYFTARCKPIFSKEKRYFALFLVVYLFGCLIFTFLMLRQFTDHDYYFLDTFFLPIIAFLSIALSLLPDLKTGLLKIILLAFIAFTALFLLLQPIKSQETRREIKPWDRTEATIENFSNASDFLDSLEISRNSKMLVIDVVAPNIPFILMQRKGFGIMKLSPKNISEALKWEYDYIVIQNEFFLSDTNEQYFEILPKLNKIADNGRISVYSKAIGK